MEKSEEIAKTAIPVRDDDGNFIFRKEWLAKYAVIDGPMSKVPLTVTSTPNLYDPEDGTSTRYIVNLKAVLRSDLAKLKTTFKGADHVRADELNKLFLSGTIWVNEGVAAPEIPMKGEQVLCNIDFVFSPAENQDVLRVTGISVLPPQEAPKINVDAMFAEDAAGAFEGATVEDFEKAGK